MRSVITGWLLMWAAAFAAPALAQEPVGDFYRFDRRDPLSGEDRSSITTLAVESHVSGAGGLTVQCTAVGPQLILTATYFGRSRETPVRYAFGDEEPVTTAWTLRSTGMAAIAPPEVMEAFLARAVSERTARFEVRDFQMRTHPYTFHLGRLDSALARLSCR